MNLIDNGIQHSAPHTYNYRKWQEVLYYAYCRLMLLQPLALPTLFSTESTPNTSHYDVLVVGAGPSGSMCAYSLVKAGLKVKIIDKKYVRSLLFLRLHLSSSPAPRLCNEAMRMLSNRVY